MGAASAIGAAIGIAGSINQIITGAKQAREAKKALQNYQRQEFRNVAEGLSVSTLGADLRREESARTQAGTLRALQSGGARTLLGGVGRVARESNLINQQISADLDMQQKDIDRLYATDEANIRQMQEQREIQDLAGLGQQLNVGQQNLSGGIGGLSQGLMSIGNMGQANQSQQSLSDQYAQRSFQQPVSAIQTSGLASLGGYDGL